MGSGGTVTRIIERLKRGDEDAAQALFERYYEALVRITRHKFGDFPRRREDEEDVAQSAFARFCLKVRAGYFPKLSDRDGLWRLFVRIASNKVTDRMRKRLERGESAFGNSAEDGRDGIHGVADEASLREESEDFSDLLEMLLGILDDRQREVALLRLKGRPVKAIAQKMNCALRTVERQLELIRAKWRTRLKHIPEFRSLAPECPNQALQSVSVRPDGRSSKPLAQVRRQVGRGRVAILASLGD